MDGADVDRVIAHPRSMIGSDGLPNDRHPHPRLWGAFPRVLAHYWRERGLLTLEQAVHKMTGLTARNFRLEGRGLLRPGGFADITVFDPARVADTATYAEPARISAGITAVYVNGQLAYREQAQVLARAGRVLARQERGAW
jgi:N-acyl-D-amino-acid deacylase